MEIWNPNTAEVYNFDSIVTQVRSIFGSRNTESKNIRMNDPICTMRKIWCVISQKNVYANIQKEESPAQIRYNLDNIKDWKPFMDGKTYDESSMRPIQSKELKYQPPFTALSALEDQIKNFLAGKFEDERIAQVKKTTNWNITIGEDLKKVLIADKNIAEEHLRDVKSFFDPKTFDNQKG